MLAIVNESSLFCSINFVTLPIAMVRPVDNIEGAKQQKAAKTPRNLPSSLSVNLPSACLSSNRSMQIGALVSINAMIFWPVLKAIAT